MGFEVGDKVVVIEHEESVGEEVQVDREGIVVQDDSDGSSIVNIIFVGGTIEWCYNTAKVRLIESRSQTSSSEEDDDKSWAYTNEDEVEFVESKPPISSFEANVDKVLNDLKVMLIQKNKKYGDSALNPIRLFSNSSPTEQIKVRLDDKISRLKVQSIEEDEDVLNDLLGYLVLLKIAGNVQET